MKEPATLDGLIGLMDERAPKPNRPKTYKKRGTISNAPPEDGKA